MATNQKVGSSNLSGRTILNQAVAAKFPIFYFVFIGTGRETVQMCLLRDGDSTSQSHPLTELYSPISGELCVLPK